MTCRHGVVTQAWSGVRHGVVTQAWSGVTQAWSGDPGLTGLACSSASRGYDALGSMYVLPLRVGMQLRIQRVGVSDAGRIGPAGRGATRRSSYITITPTALAALALQAGVRVMARVGPRARAKAKLVRGLELGVGVGVDLW